MALCPAPGASGDYGADLRIIRAWKPALVLSMTSIAELKACGAETFARDIAQDGVDWLHIPVPDFGVPAGLDWAPLHARLTAHFAQGDGVLIHCKGGCGRSGMLVLRAMISSGEAPEAALTRLRRIRPCAVETQAQLDWASQG